MVVDSRDRHIGGCGGLLRVVDGDGNGGCV